MPEQCRDGFGESRRARLVDPFRAVERRLPDHVKGLSQVGRSPFALEEKLDESCASRDPLGVVGRGLFARGARSCVDQRSPRREGLGKRAWFSWRRRWHCKAWLWRHLHGLRLRQGSVELCAVAERSCGKRCRTNHKSVVTSL